MCRTPRSPHTADIFIFSLQVDLLLIELQLTDFSEIVLMFGHVMHKANDIYCFRFMYWLHQQALEMNTMLHLRL